MIRLLLRLIVLAVLAVLAYGLYQQIEPSVAHDIHRDGVPAKVQTVRRDLELLPHLHSAG